MLKLIYIYQAEDATVVWNNDNDAKAFFSKQKKKIPLHYVKPEYLCMRWKCYTESTFTQQWHVR